jgi:aminoglycoside phosphotransferase (APT) family kinase protein
MHLDELATDEAALATLKPGDEDRLRAALPALRALIEEAAGLGIPETLVHGDLHAGNVGLRDVRIAFFDWTDACIGHPFLDLATFVGGNLMPDVVAAEQDRLRAAYLDEWRGVADVTALIRAGELVETLGMLHQVVSYQRMLAVVEEPDRSAMASGVTGWTSSLLDRVEGTTGK